VDKLVLGQRAPPSPTFALNPKTRSFRLEGCNVHHEQRANGDTPDHPFIIGSKNAITRPLVEVMNEAVVVRGVTGDALQAVEDDWLVLAGLKL
jgi:hypothetical protein